MASSDEAVHAALARLQQKMEVFDAERARAWASLRSHPVSDDAEGTERWPSIAAGAARRRI